MLYAELFRLVREADTNPRRPNLFSADPIMIVFAIRECPNRLR